MYSRGVLRKVGPNVLRSSVEVEGEVTHHPLGGQCTHRTQSVKKKLQNIKAERERVITSNYSCPNPTLPNSMASIKRSRILAYEEYLGRTSWLKLRKHFP